MFVDKTSLILAIIAVVVLYYLYSNGNTSEYMAPLNYGTYKNNYPRGGCNTGSFKRTDCMVGSCPIGSPVTDEEFCYIQSAQGLDDAEREKYFKKCMVMMKGCR